MLFGEHLSTLQEAIGIRRFLIGSAVSAVVAGLQFVSALPGMSWVAIIPNYAIAVALVVLLLFWWVLSYATELRKQREPRIRAFLDERHNGVKLYPTRMRDGTAGVSKWVQVTVCAMTDAPLVDCEARLVSVDRINDDGSVENLLDQPIWCRWDDMEGPEKRRTTIRSGIHQGAMLFNAHVGYQYLVPDFEPPKLKLADGLKKPGNYRLDLRITAKDAPTCSAAFLLEWDGTFDKIALKAT